MGSPVSKSLDRTGIPVHYITPQHCPDSQGGCTGSCDRDMTKEKARASHNISARHMGMHAGPSDSMDLSQGQQGAGAVPEEAGLPRKLARARLPSPPCTRNIFTDGPEEEPDQAIRLTRQPPYVSRYRYLKPSRLWQHAQRTRSHHRQLLRSLSIPVTSPFWG